MAILKKRGAQNRRKLKGEKRKTIMKRMNTRMTMLNAKMEEISEEQKRIKESQRLVTEKFSRGSVCTQLRLALMFLIARARDQSDFMAAARLNKLLRDLAAKERAQCSSVGSNEPGQFSSC
ncbi:uncharacterized protein LOC111303444 isoform X2 [Durio zibethinus]|uniref:Uncharacterized protein LOC111303444 isoform X2 n=1 Tax=Durio zibethinus TaxID=66656 RepID=A0A6P5ZSQ9_DURZI|nr:uncharacterized protein LOC111303444 isoform X2 [Durio zibethinus]